MNTYAIILTTLNALCLAWAWHAVIKRIRGDEDGEPSLYACMLPAKPPHKIVAVSTYIATICLSAYSIIRHDDIDIPHKWIYLTIILSPWIFMFFEGATDDED